MPARRGSRVEARALIGLPAGLIVAGTRNVRIVDIDLFIILLPASIAAVFVIAGRMDRPGRT
ncbi:MAG: hypothetical protein HYV93_06460 [Candidatus Rokubacteria bacterium]|nr:hypothetical protein [Candidatus Rokubacteria bacterium]